MFVELFHNPANNSFTFMFSVSFTDDRHIADVLREGNKVRLMLDEEYFAGTKEAQFIQRFAKCAQRVIDECESLLLDYESSPNDYHDEYRGVRIYYSDISDLNDDALV